MPVNVYFQSKALKTLDSKLKFVKGRGAKILSDAIAQEIEDGNHYDRMNARDRYGHTVAALRTKRTGKYKGATGMPLVPFGSASRAIASFRAQARRLGGQWRIVAGWVNVTSDAGIPFLPFHFVGAGRLPKRALDGISRRTWYKINVRVKEWTKKAVKVDANFSG